MNLLRFSYQAPQDNKAFQSALSRVQLDPFAPLGALLDDRSVGVVLVTRVSPEMHRRIADAVAQVIGVEHRFANDIQTGEGA